VSELKVWFQLLNLTEVCYEQTLPTTLKNQDTRFPHFVKQGWRLEP